jgi:hypothetical protein
MKVHCLGNEFVKCDSIAKKIADSLIIPGIEFIKTDSLEGIKGDVVLMDAAEGIKETTIITDLNKIHDIYPISAHDFDLGTELKLRQTTGEIGAVKIIAIPMKGNEEEIKKEIQTRIKTINRK